MKNIPAYFTDVNYSDARIIIEEMKRACTATVGPLVRKGIKKLQTAHCTTLIYPEGKRAIGTRIELVGHLPVLAEYVARTLQDGRTFFKAVGYAAVMVSAQDVMAHGFLPDIVEDGIALHLYKWGRDNPQRLRDFADGFVDGCRDIDAEFTGGETGAVRHLVNPPHAVGDCPVIFTTTTGSTDPSLVIEDNVSPGDVILGAPSTVPHVNAISAIMRLPGFPELLKEELPDGQRFGEAVMAQMGCYLDVTKDLKRIRVKPKAMMAGSGGGVSKLAFGDREQTCNIDYWPEPLPVFRKIMDLTDPYDFLKESNAGIGWVVFVREIDAQPALAANRSLKRLGKVEQGKRGVNFRPQQGIWRDIFPDGKWLEPQEV